MIVFENGEAKARPMINTFKLSHFFINRLKESVWASFTLKAGNFAIGFKSSLDRLRNVEIKYCSLI